MTDTILHVMPSDASIEYMISITEMNNDKISSSVAKRLYLGRFFCFAPKETPIKRLLNFSDGGIFPRKPRKSFGYFEFEPVEGQEESLSKTIISLMKNKPKIQMFFREPFLKKMNAMEAINNLENHY